MLALKHFFFLLVVGLPLASFASSTSCSDASGQWIYRHSTYEGGAAPPPQLVTYHRYWGYQGKTIESQEGSQIKPAAEADIVDNIDSGKGTVLESHGTPQSGGSTFALLVTLERKSGNPVVPGQDAKKVSVYMICKNAWNYLRP